MRRTSRSRRARRTRTGGFTLLEVLGAVAILGLWYVILAGIAIQGLRSEGEADRRLRASLIADEVLADLEAQAAAGAPPPLNSDESERDEYTIRIDVENLDLPISASDEEDPREARRSSIGTTGTQSILTARASDGTGPLRTIRVQVEWAEGAAERSVSRTTYAFDIESVRTLLEGLAPTGEDDEGDSDVDDDLDLDEDDLDEEDDDR